MITTEDKETIRLNRWKPTPEVLAGIRDDCPEIAEYVQVVGAWVWVEFKKKPSAEVRAYLRGAGFRWNKDRSCWQHPCGVFRKSSPGDPRDRYGVMRIADHLDEGV